MGLRLRERRGEARSGAMRYGMISIMVQNNSLLYHSTVQYSTFVPPPGLAKPRTQFILESLRVVPSSRSHSRRTISPSAKRTIDSHRRLAGGSLKSPPEPKLGSKITASRDCPCCSAVRVSIIRFMVAFSFCWWRLQITGSGVSDNRFCLPVPVSRSNKHCEVYRIPSKKSERCACNHNKTSSLLSTA